MLSQARFVESRVHARAARFGNRRIQAELGHHGLKLDEVTAAELRDSELDRARAVWMRRFGHEQATPGCEEAPKASPRTAENARERARQARFLAARGFSTETIRRVVMTPPDTPPETQAVRGKLTED